MTAAKRRAVERFNRDNPVGTPVRFWPGVRSGEGRESATRSEAQILSGHTPVVWVEGYPGCIALTHVEPFQHDATCFDKIGHPHDSECECHCHGEEQ